METKVRSLHQTQGGSALDGSSAWSWGKSKYRVKDDKDVRAQEEVDDAEPSEDHPASQEDPAKVGDAEPGEE